VKETAVARITKRTRQDTLRARGFLGYDEAAELLGVSETWMRRAREERKLPFHRFGRCVRFAVQDLDEFIASTRYEPDDDE